MIYTKYVCKKCGKEFDYSKQPPHDIIIPDFEDNKFKYELCDGCLKQLRQWLLFDDEPTEESKFETHTMDFANIEEDYEDDYLGNCIPDTFYIPQMMADIKELQEEVKQLRYEIFGEMESNDALFKYLNSLNSKESTE